MNGTVLANLWSTRSIMKNLRSCRWCLLVILLCGCSVSITTSTAPKTTDIADEDVAGADAIENTEARRSDLRELWVGLNASVNSLSQSELAFTSNGVFGLLATPELTLYEYVAGVWSEIPNDDLGQMSPLSGEGMESTSVDYEITIQSGDLTGDGSVEFIVRFRPAPWDVIDAPNQGRNFGSVMSCDEGDCRSLPFWEPDTYSAGGRNHSSVEYIEWIDGTLFATWYGSCGRPCGLLVYEWVPTYGRLEGKEATERQRQETERSTCVDFRANSDLPLALCDAGALVALVQQQLQESGYGIDADGYFGIDTRLALKLYQKARGILATGEVDRDSWIKMFSKVMLPGDDLNGDGVITPDELRGT